MPQRYTAILSVYFSFLLNGFGQNSQYHFQADTSGADTMPVFSVVANPAFIYASRSRSPLTISSIGKEDIDMLAEPTIEPLLNSVAGLWMQTGALNTNRISIRGVGYREPFATTGIKVYLDEIPLTNGVGESSIEDIHPFLFSGIDVWRGPSSAVWGSGLGGMIHLKTKVSEQDHWNSRMQLGSFERLQTDHNLSVQYGNEKQFSTQLHYQFLHDGGYRDNNDYRKHSMTWSQQWATKNFSVKTFLHGLDLVAFIPSSLNVTDYENRPSAAAPAWGAVRGNEDYTKWITGVNAVYSGSDKWVYQAAVFGTFFHSDEVRPFNVLNESNDSYGTRHRFTVHVKQSGHVNAGIEYLHENVEFSTFETLDGGTPGIQLSNQKESRSYTNGFLQAEFDVDEKWILFGGMHLTLNQLSGSGLKTEFPVSVYPTLGANYKVSSGVSISANISRGYSNLSFDDVLNSSGMITPGIKPETGWSEEISFLFGSLQSAFARVGFYHMDIDNSVITIRIADDIFEKANAGSSVHNGVEAEYRLLPSDSKFNVEGSYTFSSHRDAERESSNQLPGTPIHRTYHRLTYKAFRFFEINLIHQFVSDVFLNDDNSAKAKGYQLFNMGIFYKWYPGKKWQLTFSGNIHNLVDTHYPSMFQINAPSQNGSLPRYYYPGKPRSFYGAVSINYQL